MVHWTAVEKNEIEGQWGKIDKVAIVQESLQRMFTVYPWTLRYFNKRPDFHVQDHAKIVSGALNKAVTHMDDIKEQFRELSRKHAEVLHVDSGSFHLLTDCILITMACHRQKNFSPEIHCIWDKFFKVVVAAISKQYH